jgi:alkylresorcinol/alkylpyrone synthase
MITIPKANIVAIATAVPPYRLEQTTVLDRVTPMFGAAAGFERLRPVFGNSGIEQRYSPMPLDWFDRPQGWPERNRQYLAAAVDLLERVAGRALDLADIRTAEIGAVVTVSTTGVATPSLGARLLDRLGLPRHVQRLPIFGLGCGGGAIGLARAATLATAMPDKAVLLLVVELCSLWFRRQDLAKSSIVASALFGDGAAAVLLRCGAPGPTVAAAGEHTWPDSLDVMGWDVAEDGLKPIFSRDIPRLVTNELGDAAGAFLARHGLRLGDIDRFICHPGGPKVVTACEEAFGLEPETLAEERAVLRDFGNMSAASVLFVLERVLAKTRKGGETWRRALLTALGPGFTAGFVLLENE